MSPFLASWIVVAVAFIVAETLVVYLPRGIAPETLVVYLPPGIVLETCSAVVRCSVAAPARLRSIGRTGGSARAGGGRS